jgi:glycosyltransferase involved in cell wall biosynthesis
MTNWECFIINDASDDNSEEIAREATKDDARFHVLSANFRNLSATRNYGISQGTGIFVCCIDSDDRLGHEDFFEVLISELEKDRTIGIAYTSLTLMDENGVLGHSPSWPPDTFDAEGQYAHVNQLPTCNVFRREAWERAGGYRPFYHMVEDAELWSTMIDIGYSAVHCVKSGWFHYRLHNKSASQVHRTGETPEPDWLEWHPWAISKDRPFAAGGRPPRGSWPVRFYNEPDVSVIIPVGPGHEELVKDALHSLEGQTHRFWECIVVNDSGHPLDLKNGFSWARVIEANYLFRLGAGTARNFGAKYAKGDYLVFLDADDMLKPTFLADTLAGYKQHGKYIYTDWLTHEKQTNWQVHETRDYSYEAVAEKPSLHPITCLIPRYWFEAVGGFDETLPAFEDVDLFMKFFVHGYCGMRVKKPLLIYNLDSGKRRKASVDYEPTFKNLLKKRYGAYMEAHNMCDCVQPPKGKQPAAPTMENAAEYKEAYGDIVLAKLVGQFVAEAPVTFRGPATRVLYGRRAKGDVFYIWQADLENSGDTFEKVENYSVEPVPTVVPDAPPDIVDTEHHKPSLGEVLDTIPPIPSEESINNNAAEAQIVDDVPEVVPMSQQVSKPKGKPGRKAKAK